VKRNTSIGLVVAIALCGVSRIDAEPLQKQLAKAERTEPATGVLSRTPSTVQQLFDFLLRKPVGPVDASPIRKSPLGVVPSNEDFDFPPCDEIPDPSVPCRVRLPVPG
jgi:hypothetical protein